MFKKLGKIIGIIIVVFVIIIIGLIIIGENVEEPVEETEQTAKVEASAEPVKDSKDDKVTEEPIEDEEQTEDPSVIEPNSDEPENLEEEEFEASYFEVEPNEFKNFIRDESNIWCSVKFTCVYRGKVTITERNSEQSREVMLCEIPIHGEGSIYIFLDNYDGLNINLISGDNIKVYGIFTELIDEFVYSTSPIFSIDEIKLLD